MHLKIKMYKSCCSCRHVLLRLNSGLALLLSCFLQIVQPIVFQVALPSLLLSFFFFLSS